MKDFIRRAWRSYWNSRPHPVKKFRESYEIDSLRKQGFTNAEILEKIENKR